MKKVWIAVAAAAVLLAAVCAVRFWGGEALEKPVSFKGYEITVPKDWVASADGTLTDKEGNIAGKYALINDPPDIQNADSYADAVASGKAKREESGNIVKSLFDTEGKGEVVHYLVHSLPNPEPYAVSITLYLNRVSRKTADNIAKSFRVPTLGSKPPAKNLVAPVFDEIDADKTAKLTLANGTVQVKNVSLIDSFMKLQSEGNATGLDVISYQEAEGGEQQIESWNHIENSNGQGYMYTYYDKGDGVYTYDNNPVIFQSITKEIIEDKDITAYRLKIGEAETARLLEIPVNLYRDNAQALLALQTSESTTESVMEILDKIMPEEERAGVTAEKADGSVTLKYDKETKVNPESISKDAAVIFALSSDINSVTAQDEDGKKYVLERDKVMQGIESSTAATKSPEEFAKFAEDLDHLETAAPEKGSVTGANDGVPSGTVIYSATVVISANTMVTHPRTGERVAVGPYAEAYGYGAYLGRPITATVTKKGNSYVATATCGGSVLASRTYATREAAQSAISLIQAYS